MPDGLDHNSPANRATYVAKQPDDDGNENPEIVNIVIENRLDALNVLILIYQPKDKCTDSKKYQKLDSFF